MGWCMWSGHRALRYDLTSASTGNEDLGIMCVHWQEFAVTNIVRFYGSES